MSSFRRFAEAFSEILSILTVLGLFGLCLLDSVPASGPLEHVSERPRHSLKPVTIDELIAQKYRQEQN